jgi:hypothetical protein
MSVNPSLTPAQVASILQNSADDLGLAGWDSTYGWGRVNAARAVSVAGTGGPADTQAPGVSITSPAAGAVLSGIATIQVSATDNVGVTSVTLTANGTTIGSSTTAPYNFAWNTKTVVNGAYSLVATGKDAAGNVGSSSALAVTVNNIADTTPPIIAITAPSAGATLSGPMVTLAVTATDNVGVVKVQYYCDGALIGTATSAPFSYKWNNKKVAAGTHSLQARASDAAGNVGISAAISVVTR